MSEEPTTGPIGGGSPGSGEPSGTPEPSGSPTTITREALVGMLPEDIRGETVFQNLNAENPIPDLANQFVNAQKMVGIDKIPAPQENWGDDQWTAFWDKAGRPDTADKYVMPEVEGVTWDDKQVSELKDLAHQTGVPQKHFETMMKKYAETRMAEQQVLDTNLKATVDKHLSDLRAELTAKGEDFDAIIQLANEGLESFEDEGLIQLFQENPILANHPSIVKTFAALAESKRESMAKRVGIAKVNSNLDARQALELFEEQNKEIIHAEPEKLSWADREKRDKILEERNKYYQMAFPEESA